MFTLSMDLLQPDVGAAYRLNKEIWGGSGRGIILELTEVILMLHLQADEPEYPTSDGEPMAETDTHRNIMVDLIHALSACFRGRDVYVSGNLLLYYVRGNPKACISPDVLVALDLPAHARPIYKVWEEGKAPDLVIEVTSKSTRKKDLRVKKALYESLGVREYLMFDPFGEYLEPRFQVFRLEAKGFVPVLVPESTGYFSPSLGLSFRVIQDTLRVLTIDGNVVPTPDERIVLAEEEQQRADQERQRADEQRQRAEKLSLRNQLLEARLRELGLDVESL